MKIGTYPIENECYPGAASLINFRTQGNKQGLNFPPLKIPIDRIGKDGLERPSVLAIHAITVA